MNSSKQLLSNDDMGDDDQPADEGIRRFIERFALLLTEAGMPRMPSRVFACVLTEDSGRLTAPELAERLEASPAAISGAVRYLTQVGMLVREREPGARRDHYRLHEDLWSEMYSDRSGIMRRMEQAMAEGAELLGPDRPAGRRLDESRAFFAFLQQEMRSVMERWAEARAART
jgi:predicted transcriptional regulator